MDIGEPERSGRHRLEDGAAIWLPMGGELEHTPHARAVVRPLPPQRAHDPLLDTDAVGLRKFNIGLVPASVTPPRTWKRAAWFAVLSSAGVLVGLAIAAAKLVGSTNPVERIGLPGYPTDVPLLTGFATTSSPPPTATTRTPGVREPGAVRPPDGVPTDDHKTAGGSSSTSRTAGAGLPEGAPPSAPVVTVPNDDARPLVDAVAIAARTERFYEQAATNADTAMTMVADSFRSNAQALLEQRFADVSLVEVTAISVDPAKGTTVSTLQVTRKDGSTTTEKRELVFTTSGDPLINAERQATDA